MEFTKEEKKAIELLKKLQKKTPYIIWGDGTPYNKNNQIQTILNLIDKQQKEIADEVLNFSNNYISKDKIREKIEELESLSKNITMQPSIYNYEIDLLKELLEENTNE